MDLTRPLECSACGCEPNPVCFCDESDAAWCQACFANTPCGREEHGEGCPTLMMWSEAPPDLPSRLLAYAADHPESVASCELLREAASAVLALIERVERGDEARDELKKLERDYQELRDACDALSQDKGEDRG